MPLSFTKQEILLLYLSHHIWYLSSHPIRNCTDYIMKGLASSLELPVSQFLVPGLRLLFFGYKINHISWCLRIEKFIWKKLQIFLTFYCCCFQGWKFIFNTASHTFYYTLTFHSSSLLWNLGTFPQDATAPFLPFTTTAWSTIWQWSKLLLPQVWQLCLTADALPVTGMEKKKSV